MDFCIYCITYWSTGCEHNEQLCVSLKTMFWNASISPWLSVSSARVSTSCVDHCCRKLPDTLGHRCAEILNHTFGIGAHSDCNACVSCNRVRCCFWRWRKRRSSSAHKCSMGFEFGENTWLLLFQRQAFACRAVCGLLLSHVLEYGVADLHNWEDAREENFLFVTLYDYIFEDVY